MEHPVKYTIDNDKPSLYKQIADTMRRDILNANICSGERLLPENKLTASFGVSLVTIQRALKVLTQENLLVRNRRGTYVSQNALQLLKYKNIGIMMPALGTELNLSQSPTNYLLFDGIHKFCHEHFWNIQIIHSKNKVFSWDRFSQSNIAGVIVVMPNEPTYELISELKKHQVPFLCINLHSKKINKDVNFINMDFYNSAIDIIQSLYKKGAKKIAIVNTCGLRDDSHGIHAINGYKQAVNTLGLKENIINLDANDDDSTLIIDFFRRNFQRIKKYDALITTEPNSAFCLFEVLNEGKVKIPEEVSLTTFFENEDTRRVGITSCVPDLISLGYESVCLLGEIFDDKDKKLKQREIKPQMINRLSA